MTKIERKTQKIFAGNADTDELAVFGSMISGTPVYNDDIEALQSEAYTEGWKAAVAANEAPFMEEMNAVQYGFSKQLAYLFQQGIPEWDAGTTYYLNSFCQVGGVIYKSKLDENINHSPGDDTEEIYWTPFKAGDSGSGGLEVCDIGMSLYIDETKGLRRWLNGQIVAINQNTQGFLTRLKKIVALYPSLLTTEENWQAAKTLSDYGQVGKFVFNYAEDEKTVESVRLPAVVNVQGLLDLQNLGMTVEAGLPNIEGMVYYGHGYLANATGAFYRGVPRELPRTTDGKVERDYELLFDTSRSNPIYGATDTVQEEAIQYPYYIQIATGQETEVNITNEIELNNPYTLFDSKYSPAQLFNVSWLKSDGEYKPKATYVKAYEALLVESNTEVKAGTSVILPSGTIYVKHGLSVKLSTEEYTDYDFVINTSDETFRLPLKNGTEGMFGSGAVIGNGISLGFTNGSKNAGIVFGVGDSSIQAPVLLSNSAYGTAVGSIHNGGSTGFSNGNAISVVTDPTKSGLVVANAGVVPDGWTLYYYIGETVQNANLIDAGRMQEQITNINAPSRGYLVESYVNNKSWYRIYSDGWCEQGGQITVTEAATNITLLKSYKDNNYNAVGCQANINIAGYHTINVGQYNATQIQIRQNVVGTPLVNWIAMGYIK